VGRMVAVVIRLVAEIVGGVVKCSGEGTQINVSFDGRSVGNKISMRIYNFAEEKEPGQLSDPESSICMRGPREDGVR